MAEHRLQTAIIHGELAPDIRLTIPAMEKRFGIGATPLREGLSRLAARDLVTCVSNRGFRVAAVSRRDLEDVTGTRCEIEAAALRLTMAARDNLWEAALVAALHRLKRVVGRSNGPISEANADYEAAHRAFHAVLISGCGLPRLMEMQAHLYDQAFRYRRVMTSAGLDPARAIHEHQILADLAIGDDTEAACAALRTHLHLTLEAVYPTSAGNEQP